MWHRGRGPDLETTSLGSNLSFTTVVGLGQFSASQICFLIGKMGFLEHISQGAQEV